MRILPVGLCLVFVLLLPPLDRRGIGLVPQAAAQLGAAHEALYIKCRKLVFRTMGRYNPARKRWYMRLGSAPPAIDHCVNNGGRL